MASMSPQSSPEVYEKPSCSRTKAPSPRVRPEHSYIEMANESSYEESARSSKNGRDSSMNTFEELAANHENHCPSVMVASWGLHPVNNKKASIEVSLNGCAFCTILSIVSQ